MPDLPTREAALFFIHLSALVYEDPKKIVLPVLQCWNKPTCDSDSTDETPVEQAPLSQALRRIQHDHRDFLAHQYPNDRIFLLAFVAKESALAYMFRVRIEEDYYALVLVFKGTSPFDMVEWASDFLLDQVNAGDFFSNSGDEDTLEMVHMGFLRALKDSSSDERALESIGSRLQ